MLIAPLQMAFSIYLKFVVSENSLDIICEGIPEELLEDKCIVFLNLEHTVQMFNRRHKETSSLSRVQ